MTIREGSRGHTDPAGKNWSKWFGGEPLVEVERPTAVFLPAKIIGPLSARCGAREASCLCCREAGHAPPCVCDCRGAWSNESGGFRIWSFPVSSGLLTVEEAEAFGVSLTNYPEDGA